MIIIEKGTIVELDMHGMYADNAELEIEQFLDTVGPKVQEVVVIHGYHKGQVLMDMVRTRLVHPRIASKIISLNKGQTRLILKF